MDISTVWPKSHIYTGIYPCFLYGRAGKRGCCLAEGTTCEDAEYCSRWS